MNCEHLSSLARMSDAQIEDEDESDIPGQGVILMSHGRSRTQFLFLPPFTSSSPPPSFLHLLFPRCSLREHPCHQLNPPYTGGTGTGATGVV